MSLENDTQSQVEANPVTGAIETPQNEGTNGNVQPQAEPEKENEGKTYSQKDLDNIAAKTRGATERETKKKLLAQLGLSLDDEEKLSKYKEAYENSLSEEEKKSQEIDSLTQENINLQTELDEKDYIIQALIEMSGKKESDVEKIVKMAKGLKTDDNTIKDCIKEVMSMINIDGGNTNNNQSKTPVSQPLTQPSSTVSINADMNPFKAGTINLTEQGRLVRENPELARRLAAEAGVDLRI